MVLRSSNWTPEETELARKLLAEGAPEREFERQIGRTKEAAKTRIQTLNYRARRAEADRFRTLSGSRCKKSEYRRVEAEAAIPPEVIADSVRRSDAPRSLTAMLCGDPPPGYSALDRRRANP